MLQPRLNVELPRNESEAHFLLKQVAMAWLKLNMHCWAVATEVWEMGGVRWYEHSAKIDYLGDRPRDVADAVGVGNNTVRCVEVKVSRSDYASGFCCGGDYNYVLTPKGLLKPEELPAGIGLIEADMDEIAWRYGSVVGLSVVKKPRRKEFARPETHEQWVQRIVNHIASRACAVWVYENPWFHEEKKQVSPD